MATAARAEPPLDAVPFLDPALQAHPYPFYARLHAEAPVWREPATGFWIVARYADMQAIIKDTATFSNDLLFVDRRPGGVPAAVQAEFAKGYARPQVLQRSDPPVHTRYRKLVDRAFTASRVKELTPWIEAVSAELIDAMAGKDEVDFVRDYAVPLPCIVIAAQLGMPREDIAHLKRWSDALLDPVGMMITPERELECAREVVEFQHYFAAKVAERRAAPRDDILSALVGRMDDADAPLSTEEILNLMEQLLTGGNETTTSTIAAALLLLIEHPEQQTWLRANLSAETIRNFVEEVLRVETPVQGLFRQTTRDAEVSGVTIPAGAIVMLRHGAVNRDPAKFDAPDRFDIRRRNAGAQLAFGAGAHFCPGAMLARQELATAFTQLLTRFSAFELVPAKNDFAYHPSFFLRGLKRLWVRLTPA